MALTTDKKIAVWLTVKQAYQMLWAARRAHIALSPLAVLPLILMGLMGWLDPIFTLPAPGTALPPAYIQAELLFLGWVLIWLVPCGLLWQRLFLVGPQHFLRISAGHLFMMWLRLLGYYLALTFLLAGLAVLFLAASSGLVMVWQSAFGISASSIAGAATGTATFAFGFCALLIIMRLMPAFVSVALGENISPRRSWAIMQNNTALLVLISLLVMLPISTISDFITGQLVGLVSGVTPGQTGIAPGPNSYLVILCLSPLISAAAALQMAVMAIIYRDLVPQPDHLVDVTV